MNKPTICLAVTGATLIWGVILLTIINAVIVYMIKHYSSIQYLMPPGRLSQIYLLIPLWTFWVASIGGGLTLWAALRERLGTVTWSLGISLGMLAGVQALIAVVFSGGIEPVGWKWQLVQLAPGIYGIALLTAGICAVMVVLQIGERTVS